MSRSTKHVLLVYLMFMCTSSFVFSKVLILCPERIHWKTVGHIFCPESPGYYHCLQRKDTHEFKPECIKPVVVPQGYYPVLDEFHHNTDGEKCPVEQYQPRPMPTNEDYQCVYQKSKCSDEGQLMYSNGSTTEDITCRCDYRKAYTFVNKPARECYCVPSEEDCSCYRKTCTGPSDLTKDYECLKHDEDNENKTSIGRNCSLIHHTSSHDGQSSDKGDLILNDETYSSIPRQDTKNRKHAAIDMVTLLGIYGLILIIYYLWKRQHNVYGVLKLMVKRNKYSESIGSDVTLTVTVVEAGDIASFIFGRPDISEITWMKNGKPIEEPNECSEADNCDLLIQNLKCEDEAEYLCVVKNLAGNSFISQKIKLTIVNTPAEHKHRTIQLVFVGPKDSGKTTLLRNLLGIQTELLNKFCLRLESEKWTVTAHIQKALVEEQQDKYINLIIIDIPGGSKYLSIFEPFLSRKALYVLTVNVDKNLFVGKAGLTNSMKRKSGEDIQNWLYSIHLKAADPFSTTQSGLQPLVILVGTHKDQVAPYTFQARNLQQELETKTLSCVDEKDSIIISKHIVHSCVVSNKEFSEEMKKALQDIIIKKSQDNWDSDIPERFLGFEDKLIEKRSKMVTMSFDDILELGKASGYPVTDKREFQQFLSYEHEVRNVIFYPDIPDFVIINPEWLLGIFKALITLFHSETESKSDYQLRGLISENSLNTILLKLGSDWSKNKELLKTFDVVVGARNAGKIESEHEPSYRYEYYVPFVIPEDRTADVVSLFSRSRSNKTSFLCFSFDYLPAALVNHVMIRLLERYEVSVTPDTDESAVYYRTLVLEYHSRTKLKLYFQSRKNELLIQVWFYGVHDISVCFEDVRKFKEQIINSFKTRHGMNVNYTYKLKCPDSDHADTDVWEILSKSADRTFFCHKHKRIHHQIYTTWFSGGEESQEKEPDGAKKKLEETMGRSIQQSVSVLGLPTIHVETTSYSVTRNSVVTLKCRVRIVAGNVTWRRKYKGHELNVPTLTTKYSGGNSGTPSLTIYNVGEDDQGLYWCVATNSCGTAISDQINLTVY